MEAMNGIVVHFKGHKISEKSRGKTPRHIRNMSSTGKENIFSDVTSRENQFGSTERASLM